MNENVYQQAKNIIETMTANDNMVKQTDGQWKIALFLFGTFSSIGLAVLLKPLAIVLVIVAFVCFIMIFVVMIQELRKQNKQVDDTKRLRILQDKDILHELLQFRYKDCKSYDNDNLKILEQSKLIGRVKNDEITNYGNHHIVMENGHHVDIISFRKNEQFRTDHAGTNSGYRSSNTYEGILLKFTNAHMSDVPFMIIDSYVEARIAQYAKSYYLNKSQQMDLKMQRDLLLIASGVQPCMDFNKEFSKYYSLYARDENEAKRVIASKIEQLISLRKEYKSYFCISYIGTDIFVYIHNPFQYLQLSSNGILINEELEHRYVSTIMQLDKIFNIVRL